MSALPAVLRARVAARRLAFEAGAVRAVLLSPEASPFPGAAPSLRGLLGWRDHVVPLVTLAPERVGRLAVVLDGGGAMLAVEVDEVEGLAPRAHGDDVVGSEALARLVRADGAAG